MRDVVIYIVLFIILHKILNCIFYKKRVGVLVLTRRKEWIYTSFSLRALIRYIIKGKNEFKNDCEKFFDELEKNIIYTTESHALILRNLEKKNTNVIYSKEKPKRMILTKLMIGNTKKIFKKQPYYKICFQKKDL